MKALNLFIMLLFLSTVHSQGSPPSEVSTPSVEDIALSSAEYGLIRTNTRGWVDQFTFSHPSVPDAGGEITGASWLQHSEYSYQIARHIYQNGEGTYTWNDLFRLILHVCNNKGSVADWTHQNIFIPRNVGFAMAYAYDYIEANPSNVLGQDVMNALPNLITYMDEDLIPWSDDDDRGANLLSISVSRLLVGAATENIAYINQAYQDTYSTITPVYGNGTTGLWPDYSWNQHPVGSKLQAHWSNYGMVWIDQIRYWEKFTDGTGAQFSGGFRDAMYEAIAKGFTYQVAGGYRNPLQAGRESNSKEGYLLAYQLVGILNELKTLGAFTASQEVEMDKLIIESDLPQRGNVGRSLSKYFPQTLTLTHSKQGAYVMYTRLTSKNHIGPEQGIYVDTTNIHLGDGAVLIDRNPLDWHRAKPCLHWYAIAGVTAINTYDNIPTQANAANFGQVNSFAGGVQNGRSIAQSFFLNRSQPWHYNRAFKSILTEGDTTILEGSAVSVKSGFTVPGGNEIWTTFAQNLATDQVYANIGNGQEEITLGTVRDIEVNQPVWFYHNNIGYVVIPNGLQTLKVWHETRNGNWNNAASHMGGEAATEFIFQLSISHGNNPQGDCYRCV
ncbi:MAG: polysaccharide lyase family 8 super-sandwich domain-containing protein, partial [Bacteroidota bacterium]